MEKKNNNNNNTKFKRNKLLLKNEKNSSTRNNQLVNKMLPPQKPNIYKMVLKSLIIIIFFIVLSGFVYMSYKTVVTYTQKNKIKNKGDMLIIDDWVDGMSNEFDSDVNMDQLGFGNNYSFSFMIYLNESIDNHQKTKQVIFKKGSDLELIIPPLEHNFNKNILKLIFKLERPQLIETNESLKTPLIKQINDDENDENIESITDSNNDQIQPFTNLSNNNIDYFTVHSGHSKEKFELIQNKQFENSSNIDKENTENIENNEVETDTLCIEKDKLIDHDYVEIHNIPNAKVNHITVSIHNNIVDIYNNGQLESSKLLTNLPMFSGMPFTFFKENGLNGYIKSFRYYNRALTQDDVEKYYNNDLNKSKKFTLF